MGDSKRKDGLPASKALSTQCVSKAPVRHKQSYLDEVGVGLLKLQPGNNGGGAQPNWGDRRDLGAIAGTVLQNLVGVCPNVEAL